MYFMTQRIFMMALRTVASDQGMLLIQHGKGTEREVLLSGTSLNVCFV